MDDTGMNDHDFAQEVRTLLGAETNDDALASLKETAALGEDEVVEVQEPATNDEPSQPNTVDPDAFTERTDPSQYVSDPKDAPGKDR